MSMTADTVRCEAKKRGGGTCKARAGWGTDHVGIGRCKLHGGNTANHRASADMEKAKLAVATYGLAREVDPHAALLEELHRTAGHVAWLQVKVADLDEDRVTHLIVADDDRNEVVDERTSEWIKLYQVERKHFAQIAKTCIDVGIEERRVRIAEQTGQLFAQALDRILTELGVRNHPEAPAVVRRHLTALDGGLAA